MKLPGVDRSNCLFGQPEGERPHHPDFADAAVCVHYEHEHNRTRILGYAGLLRIGRFRLKLWERCSDFSTDGVAAMFRNGSIGWFAGVTTGHLLQLVILVLEPDVIG